MPSEPSRSLVSYGKCLAQSMTRSSCPCGLKETSLSHVAPEQESTLFQWTEPSHILLMFQGQSRTAGIRDQGWLRPRPCPWGTHSKSKNKARPNWGCRNREQHACRRLPLPWWWKEGCTEEASAVPGLKDVQKLAKGTQGRGEGISGKGREVWTCNAGLRVSPTSKGPGKGEEETKGICIVQTAGPGKTNLSTLQFTVTWDLSCEQFKPSSSPCWEFPHS